MAQYSIPRAAERLKQERVNTSIGLTQRQAKLQELTKNMQVSYARVYAVLVVDLCSDTVAQAV